MASERMIAPAVFTRENDLSSVRSGIIEIGAAVVGPTAKGPAFVPKQITSYSEYVQTFGNPNLESFVPYTVASYLENGSTVTVVRVVGTDGYKTDAMTIALTGSATVNGTHVCTLVPTSNTYNISAWTASYAGSGSADPCEFYLHSGTSSYTCSFNPNKDKFVDNIFGKTPESKEIFYVYDSNPAKLETISNYFAVTSSLQNSTTMSLAMIQDGIDLESTTESAYSEAYTPSIVSQLGTELFEVHHFNEGPSDVYISIDNIKFASEVPGSEYGSFNLYVRQLGDTDIRPVILEQFIDVSLDPSSTNFIAKKIGDKYSRYVQNSSGDNELVTYGDYANNSKYIRIVMKEQYTSVEVPFGFGSYYAPVEGTTVYRLTNRTIQKSDITDTGVGSVNPFNFKYYLGFDQTYKDNLFVTHPLPEGTSVVANSSFSLANIYVQSGSVSSTVPVAVTDYTAIPLKSRKFSVALQGGYDGMNPTVSKKIMVRNTTPSTITATNTMGFDCSTPTSSGTKAYIKAIETLSNANEIDIKLLFTPGIISKYHSTVVNYADNMCDERGDVFYVFDSSAISDTVEEVASNVSSMDSNYSATYHPWVKIRDIYNNTELWAPPSVAIAGVYAFNDRYSSPWHSPAGFSRGEISGVVELKSRLTKGQQNTLYESKVNPIVHFVNEGNVVWGGRNLQTKDTALNRINVRRLLIEVKKYISSIAKYYVFEFNDVKSRTEFVTKVRTYLENVKSQRGLYLFEVVVDERNNTPDVIDRNEMVAEIYLQPSRSTEKFLINFNITNTGTSFDI